MTVNRWRWVGYEDDGVDRFECLKCGTDWSMRGRPGPYCSWCGTKWDGEVVWNTEEREERRHRIMDRIRGNTERRKRNAGIWVIESRVLWNMDGAWKPWVHEETDGWTKHDEYPADAFSAKAVHAALAELRRWHPEERTTRIEYRASLREKERLTA